MGIGFRELLVIVFGVFFIVVPFWKIFAKAGLSPGFALLMLVPVVNVILLYYLAFASWPAIEKPRG